MKNPGIRLTEHPPTFVAFAQRRVTPFLRYWMSGMYSGELNLMFLLCSVYAQGIRDAEQVANYKSDEVTTREFF